MTSLSSAAWGSGAARGARPGSWIARMSQGISSLGPSIQGLSSNQGRTMPPSIASQRSLRPRARASGRRSSCSTTWPAAMTSKALVMRPLRCAAAWWRVRVCTPPTTARRRPGKSSDVAWSPFAGYTHRRLAPSPRRGREAGEAARRGYRGPQRYSTIAAMVQTRANAALAASAAIANPATAGAATAGGRQTVASACPLDCPDACSLSVEVEGGRVVKLDGSRRNPLTAGFICAKVRRWPEHMAGDHRLLHPEIRRGRKGEGVFERVSWDEALALAAERLSEARDGFGGESILPFSYGGSNGLLTQDTTDLRLFARLGASRLDRTVCAAPSRSAARGLYGLMPGVALPDYRHARLIVLWGVNPAVTGIHLVPIIQDAQRAGATLVVVDPRRTPLAKRADLHLAPRPGTDLPLALAVIRWLFEEGRADLGFLAAHARGAAELRRRAAPWDLQRAAAVSGVPAVEIERFARLYADSSPAVMRTGWGVERNRNGGSAVAATLALPAVAGKFGVRGGGYTMSNSGAWNLDHAAAAAVSPADADLALGMRIVNMNLLGETLLGAEPPVRVLFVYNCNPLATMPDQERVRRGLEREDLFTVVFDPVRTDTARYADLLLPATTFLEHHELVKGYGAFVLHQAAPAIEPAGEARPNYQVFGELCDRLGLSRPQDPEGAAALTSALLGGAE